MIAATTCCHFFIRIRVRKTFTNRFLSTVCSNGRKNNCFLLPATRRGVYSGCEHMFPQVSYQTRTFTIQSVVDGFLNRAQRNSQISFQLSENTTNADVSVSDGVSAKKDLSNFFDDGSGGTSSLLNSTTDLSLLDLTTWLPPYGVAHTITFIHDNLPCEWWAAISLTTLIARCFVFPLMISMQRKSAQMLQSTVELNELQNKFLEAHKNKDIHAVRLYGDKIQKTSVMQLNHLKRFMWRPMLNGAVFSSFFLGIREMANFPIQSMKSGGVSWFTDLTVGDPYYALPFMTCATLFVVFKLGVEFGNNNMLMQKQMMLLTYGLPLICFCAMSNFPSALSVYWLTNNTISLVQSILLKQNGVRRFLKLPILEGQVNAANTNSMNFKEDFNKSLKMIAAVEELKERKLLEDRITEEKKRL